MQGVYYRLGIVGVAILVIFLIYVTLCVGKRTNWCKDKDEIETAKEAETPTSTDPKGKLAEEQAKKEETAAVVLVADEKSVEVKLEENTEFIDQGIREKIIRVPEATEPPSSIKDQSSFKSHQDSKD